jgi:hypothetical protein
MMIDRDVNMMIVLAGMMTDRDGSMTTALAGMTIGRDENMMIVPAGTMTGRDATMTIGPSGTTIVRDGSMMERIVAALNERSKTGRSGMNGPEGSGKPRRSPMGLEPRLLGRHEKRSDGNLHA